MNQFKTTQRTCARLSISLIVGALLATGITAPSQAAITAPTPILNSSELIDSLIVKYEPGAAVVDKTGNPNGEAAVTENVDLTVGESIGLGYRTINLDQPIPVAEAQAVAVQLAGTAAISSAEPNYTFSVQDSTSQDLQGNTNLWGLDRLDQSTTSLNSTYRYSSTGTGVTAYVVDTGIRSSHQEFVANGTTRVRSGWSAIDDGLGTEDCMGHGTHVAGIIGGKTFGVAKNASLVSVRVLNCKGSGTTEDVINAIGWIIADHAAGSPAVANFSLGPDQITGQDSNLNSAMTALISDGVQPIVASGNTASDACSFSPANTPGTLTVSASDWNDQRASFSNYGNCTDVYAPGVSILSAGIDTASCTEIKSGTSMATPFVTGLAVNILQRNPNYTTDQLVSAILASTQNKIYSGYSGDTRKLITQSFDATGITTPWASNITYNTCAAARQIIAQEAAAAAAEVARIAAEKAAADAIAAEIASRTINTKTKYSARVLAGRVGVPYTSKATVTLTVAKASKKICSLSGTKLRTLKSGNCVVTIKVQEPKPKKGKRPAATKTVKTFIVQ